jgi:2-polyprenyl-3-methyl-5-hydroxy-6-metoxy-1,4-benzoquinol methylase
MSTEDSSTRSWNDIADDWVAHADTNDYRNLFLFPLTFTLLGDLQGRRVLDLGSGEGGYSREMARRGAKVVAVDGSERLIEVAQKRARRENLAVESICSNASSLKGIADESFDLVLASMSLMDVEDYDGAIRQCHRVLVRGGELLMSITHPCFSAPVSEWIRDDQGQPRAFAVDRYFERTAWKSVMARGFGGPVLRRHRPLEDYMRSPIESGFILRDFREPAATADDVKKSRRFEKITRVPYFLFMRWQKS